MHGEDDSEVTLAPAILSHAITIRGMSRIAKNETLA